MSQTVWLYSAAPPAAPHSTTMRAAAIVALCCVALAAARRGGKAKCCSDGSQPLCSDGQPPVFDGDRATPPCADGGKPSRCPGTAAIIRHPACVQVRENQNSCFCPDRGLYQGTTSTRPVCLDGNAPVFQRGATGPPCSEGLPCSCPAGAALQTDPRHLCGDGTQPTCSDGRYPIRHFTAMRYTLCAARPCLTGTAPPRPARTVASPVPALTGHNCPAAVDGGDGVAGVAGAVVAAGLEEGGAEGGAELLLFLYQLASFDKLEMEVVTYFFLQRNTPPQISNLLPLMNK